MRPEIFGQGKIQTAQDKGQLLVTVELVRDEKSADGSVADDLALSPIGVFERKDCADPLLLGLGKPGV